MGKTRDPESCLMDEESLSVTKHLPTDGGVDRPSAEDPGELPEPVRRELGERFLSALTKHRVLHRGDDLSVLSCTCPEADQLSELLLQSHLDKELGRPPPTPAGRTIGGRQGWRWVHDQRCTVGGGGGHEAVLS